MPGTCRIEEHRVALVNVVVIVVVVVAVVSAVVLVGEVQMALLLLLLLLGQQLVQRHKPAAVAPSSRAGSHQRHRGTRCTRGRRCVIETHPI